uniref:Uncharacterized protein n=1 Tax=Triticum urartu TaxID=4572 RepID=A0A8R7P928_TRIUA
MRTNKQVAGVRSNWMFCIFLHWTFTS